MKKLFYSTLVCLCSSLTFVLIAAEPDISNLATFQDVLYELDASIVTHLDLRLAKANVAIYSAAEKREFPSLDNVENLNYKVVELDKCSKIVCDVNIRKFRDKHFFVNDYSSDYSGYGIPYIGNYAERLLLVKNIYLAVKGLAKKHINHFIKDENMIVKMFILTDETVDGKVKITKTPILKWENGEAIYYEGFIKI